MNINDFLTAADTDIAANNAYYTIDLDDYKSGASPDFNPANIYDVMKSVVPRISTAMSMVYKNYQMYPEFLVAGLKTASLLRSMQQ